MREIKRGESVMKSKPSSETPWLTADTRKFVKALEKQGGPPLYKLAIPDARQVLLDAQSGKIKAPAVESEDLKIPLGSGSVGVRLVRPEKAGGTLPLICYFHGGGWILGNRDTHDRLVRELCAGTGAAVAFVEYTPSPEAEYPVPLKQAFAVLQYLAVHAGELKLDPERIAVAGDSVGGNMAAAMPLISKAKKGPKIIFQALFYPVTNAKFDTDSYRKFAEGPWLTRRAMKWFWNAYAPDRRSRNEITASPLRASLKDLTGLPPALVITAQNDVLRDEGEAYAQKLMEAGVEVTALRCNGTIHDFMMLSALAESAPARLAVSVACDALRNAFRQ